MHPGNTCHEGSSVWFGFDGGAIADRVIDGVWFGEEYERMMRTLRNCTSNYVCFPKGLNSFVDGATFRIVAASGEKLQFAIWVESDRSKPQDLYSFDKHPDWALQAEGYLPVEQSLQPARPRPRATRRVGPNHGKNDDTLIRSAPTAFCQVG
ncbi:alpha-galactosidase C [Beauveria bassiana ARSEF 2860]|uniref:Alpha-galactosidase C n=1 Tax=Beauveria bassiana (strain ARSEF 2860) TaxID=655819 RepID=J5JYU2_BEAB2|nr:alpha-galactosidase C [Beauveria bassiana ARSEF 2860]EJP67321.1 alpha-galactosidase C [Beauveria bassiana ARSEF 2860]